MAINTSGINQFLNNLILKVSTGVLSDIVISDMANSGNVSSVETRGIFHHGRYLKYRSGGNFKG